MATTAAQMIAWLQTLPPEAEIECGHEVTASYSTYMEYAPVDLEYSDVCDYRSDEDRVKYPNMAGKVLVCLRSD